MSRILIVEDDSDLLYLYQTALSLGGFDPVIASNATKAMAELDQGVFDLIFLDLNMPDHHGSVVINHTRSDERHKDSKIVIITANDHWIDKMASTDIQDVLIKPVSMTEIIEIARKLIG